MLYKDQAARLTIVIGQLESCINDIMSTGDLSEWMSPDGITLLGSTLKGFEDHKRFLEDLPDTSLNDADVYLWRDNLEVQIKSYENLLLHLTSTLKLAKSHQAAKTLKPPSPEKTAVKKRRPRGGA